MWAQKPEMAKKWTAEHGSKPVNKNKGGKMPKVGEQKFPYTSAGVQQAQKHAKKHWAESEHDWLQEGWKDKENENRRPV